MQSLLQAAGQLGSEAAKFFVVVEFVKFLRLLTKLKLFTLAQRTLPNKTIDNCFMRGESGCFNQFGYNHERGVQKYKNLDRATECAMTDIGGEDKNTIKSNQPNCLAALNLAASPEMVFSRFTTPHSLKRKSAFTLAEVLITLGIIGVVAALTIPNLIANYKNKIVAKQLQKTYSTLSQAISMAQAEYGDISQWPIQDGKWESTDAIFKDYLNPHLKIVKECRNSTECFPQIGRPAHYYTFILADGTQVMLDVWNHQENTDDLFISYGVMSASKHYVYNQFLAFTVDVNGDKKPNKSGEDIFIFILAKNGLIPLGLDYDQGTKKLNCRAQRTPSANLCTAYFLEKYQ